MIREFYQRPDQKLIQKPVSTKADVLRAVKEAMVETMKETKLDLSIVTEAATRIKSAFGQYVPASPQDDEMRNLSYLAIIKTQEVLRERGVEDPAVIAQFQKALSDNLPPFPESPSRTTNIEDWRDSSQGQSPSIDPE